MHAGESCEFVFTSIILLVSICAERGWGRIYARGGDTCVFLRNPLWEENLSLGYSLPWRKFQGEVLPCDTGTCNTLLFK